MLRNPLTGKLVITSRYGKSEYAVATYQPAPRTEDNHSAVTDSHLAGAVQRIQDSGS